MKVPFEVEVFGFELPDRMTVKTPFGFSTERLYRYHCVSTDVDKAAVLQRYMKYLGDNHISPDPMTTAQPVLKWKDNKDMTKASLTIDWTDFDRDVERLLNT